MVVLYVRGTRVGTLPADAEQLTRLLEAGEPVEFKSEAGRNLGAVVPPRAGEPPCPWDPTITQEELDRRAATPGGMTLAEFWKQMGVR